MPSWIWIPITVAAAATQTMRNAFQRGLVEAAGPWGATLVRFLFGLPFALAWFAAAVVWVDPVGAGWAPDWRGGIIVCALGGFAQVVATAALMVSMRRGGFAFGTALQQSSLPLSALVGLALGDQLGPAGWAGIALATSGLMMLSWPRGGAGRAGWQAAAYGLASGAAFAVSANAFRSASFALAPDDPIFAAALTLVIVQAMQTAGLVAWLSWRDRKALAAAVGGGRSALGAGAFGAAASIGWFTAVALAPAAAVRAVGVVDMPMAALAGRHFFKERMTLRQIAGAILTAAGVVAIASGWI